MRLIGGKWKHQSYPEGSQGLLSPGKNGSDLDSRGAEEAGVGLLSFAVCGACSESTWSGGDVLPCRKLT